MRKRIQLQALAAMAVGGTSLASAQVADLRFDSAETLIRRLMTEHGIPSVAVAAAKGGRIVWEQAFGWADRERMVPATAHTMYSLASISKPFTATALMRLVEQGKVDLDRPANDYLGVGRLTGLAGSAASATVRRVLTHTAGLPLHSQFYYETDPYPVPGMDQTIARYGILVYPPGQVFNYSNLGFGVIGEIIARASGQSYADYLRTEVFLPLGLTRTSVHIGPGLEPYAAQRYDATQQPIPFYRFDHDGASAIYASAHDLIRFAMFHLKDHLSDQRAPISDAAIDSMGRVGTPGSTIEGYGLGWFVGGDNGFVSLSHGGGMPGVTTTLKLYPREDVAVVVLTNRSNNAFAAIAEEIVGTMLPKYGIAVRAKRNAPPNPTPSSAAAFKPGPELRGPWSGTVRTWQGTVRLSLDIRPDGDVHVALGDQYETLLNQTRFRDGMLTGRFAGTIPTPDASRHPHTVRIELLLRGDQLAGQVSAVTEVEPRHCALSSYAELRRAR